jgi:hypothetical protein
MVKKKKKLKQVKLGVVAHTYNLSTQDLEGVRLKDLRLA